MSRGKYKKFSRGWRRVGDSNSYAPKVRRFSRPLGYRLPIPSALEAQAGIEPAYDLLCRQAPYRLGYWTLAPRLRLERRFAGLESAVLTD